MLKNNSGYSKSGPSAETIDAIYQAYLNMVDGKTGLENLVVAMVTHYGSLKIQELADYIGHDVHETRLLVAKMRAAGKLDKEGMVCL